jgi:flagellar M-ring protein FliF
MSGIEAATVHIALPKDQVFALDQEKPSASVLIQTSDTIGNEQVRAITNIVASGIQGLSTDRVSVADSKGHVLAAPGDATSGAGSGDQQESLDSYESSVSHAIESMLAASFGPGKAKVTVSADLDFDQRSTTNETYASPTTVPGATAPLAKDESTKTETYGSGAAAPSGSLGTPGAATPAGGYNLDQKDVNYALNHAVETTNHAPGTVNRLSVAVIVDERAITASELPNVQELVSAAAGVKTERGDTVVVNRMPFDSTVNDQMQHDLAARAKAKSASSSLPLFAAAGAMALLVVASTLMVMRRRKKDLRQLEELAAQLSSRPQPIDLDATGVQAAITPGNDGASVDGRFGSSAPSLIGVEGRREERQQVLTELIDNQPDEVAQLLRGWLGDRRAVKR